MGNSYNSSVPMDSVIGGSLEPSKAVLQCEYIDIDAVSNAIQTLKSDYDGRSEIIAGYKNYITTATDNTQGSNVFKLNTEPSKYLQDMNTIVQKYGSIKEFVDSIDESSILAECETYNNELEKIKKGAKMILLKQKCDALHEQKILDYSEEITLSYQKKYSVNDLAGSYKSDGVVRHEDFIQSFVKENTSRHQGEEYVTGYQYKVKRKHYKVCEYWGWFRGDFWPLNIFDWNTDTLESKFIEIFGMDKMPYNPDECIMNKPASTR